MTIHRPLALGLLMLWAPAAQAGDAAAGEMAFGQCKACHSVVSPDGAEIVQGGRIGPNLYGIAGRPIASDPEFADRYSPALLAVGADGSGWDEASFAAYVADPSGWVAARLGDGTAMSTMSFASPEGAADILAFLAALGG